MRLLGEMSEARSEAGDAQDEPGTSYYTRKQGSCGRLLGLCQNDTRS